VRCVSPLALICWERLSSMRASVLVGLERTRRQRLGARGKRRGFLVVLKVAPGHQFWR
jgi:hypothetical protein